MEVKYSKNGGPKQDECWTARDDAGQESLYVRMVAGIALPKNQQPQGCLIVIGETYRAKAPAEFTALGARVGMLFELERSLGELRQELKFDTIITEPSEEPREILRNLPGLNRALGGLYLSILQAPSTALGEIGRQRVDGIIREKRLSLNGVRAILDGLPDLSALPLQYVMNWLLDNEALYPEPRPPREYRGLLGDMEQ